jgi:hypothetical protein
MFRKLTKAKFRLTPALSKLFSFVAHFGHPLASNAQNTRFSCHFEDIFLD